MTDTRKVKDALSQRLKEQFGRQWATRVAAIAGYSPSHVRKYFSSDTRQPIISIKASELLDQAQVEEKEMLQKLQP